MLRNSLIALLSFAFVLSFVVWTENEIAQSFQACISEKAGKTAPEHSNNQGNSVAVVVKAQALCSLQLVDSHNGFFAAIAAIVVAAFTGTLWIATERLARSGQTVFEATERAFVFLDSFNYELSLATDRKPFPDY